MMFNLQEERNMKTWTKPVVTTVDAGLEVTRYLPSALDTAAGRTCEK
jgi:coenzyme PQQ precursor peptide PqqA